MVAAEQIDVVVNEQGEPLDVGVVDGGAVAPELGEGGVEVAGVPQHDGVEDQAEGAELVFLAFPVAPGGVRDRCGTEPYRSRCCYRKASIRRGTATPPVPRLSRSSWNLRLSESSSE